MTDPEHSSDARADSGADNHDVAGTANLGRRSADFGELARRLRSRTTDLIVIAFVTGVGLSLAGWVTEWWRRDPHEATVSRDLLPPAPWESPDGVVLQFGDQPWTMQRRSMGGDEAAVMEALTNTCVDLLTRRDRIGPLPDPENAELRLLESLDSFAPLKAVAGEWAVYEIGGFLPWVVGISESIPGNSPDADRRRRLLCWALALQQPDGNWVLHTIDRQGGSGGATGSVFDLPLPAGARPSLRLFDEQGGSLTCLSGIGSAEEWSRDTDVAWSRAGWRIERNWASDGNARSAVYLRVNDKGLKQTAEIVLSDAGTAEALGTIIVTTEPHHEDNTSEAP